jgi:hypothetical protein
MSKYLARLKALNEKKRSLQQVPKVSKGAFGTFDTDQGEHVFETRKPFDTFDTDRSGHVFPERSGGEKAGEQPKVAAQSPAAARFSDLYATEQDYARALIRYSRQDGLGLHISTGHLVIAVPGRNDPDLLGELRKHENAVMEVLRAERWGNWR